MSKIPKIDYSGIAPKFDRAREKNKSPLDEDLVRIGQEKTPVFALDIGCGTGNYIRAQIEQQSRLVE